MRASRLNGSFFIRANKKCVCGISDRSQIWARWIRATKLESLFHRLFVPAQLDLTIQDCFGASGAPTGVVPRSAPCD